MVILLKRRMFAIALGIMPLLAEANQLRVMALDEKVAKSDIVVIGTVVGIDPNVDSREYIPKYAVVNVLQSLKGLPGKAINVQYRGPIAEEDPVCCVVGKNYLFFLKKIGETSYVSTNHRLGVYNLTDMK
ncbi:hypothetical protein [Pseudoduganella violaceinigra]|uniref:hypothetical protein n=1 Tax=Pseudoduganella violaceinigra TaxID=246602 RepID=UPI0012B61F70|nr:hypothetical protein [Pseudoduganella violaceinigra]